jgi:riboflavin kinase/FMN adenylyltransferase
VAQAASVVTIGVFDGVHLGHRELVRRVRAAADEGGLGAVAVTFDPHPVAVLRPERMPRMLTTLPRRVALLEEAGVDRVEVVPFTTERSHQSPEDFVAEVLRERLQAVRVIVGTGFHFGHKAAGTVDTLRRCGLDVDAVDYVHDEGSSGDVISSTWCRARVADGDMPAVRRVLTRPHLVEGPVVRGEARGRALGYPTANVDVDPWIAVPADGVYAGTLVRASGQRMAAAISVGTNPTFDGVARTVEAYAIDVGHELELYGEHVAVEFTDRLRGMEKFAGVDELIEQMALDVEQARARWSSAGA